MYDLIIIGAGPAGIACGIEAKKAGLNYVILDKGYLVNSLYHFPTNMTFFSTSRNLEIGDVPFISHADKPTRKEALEYYRRIVSSYNLNVTFRSHVVNIEQNEGQHIVYLDNGIELTSTSIVIATGYFDNARPLNVPGENLSKVKHYYDDAHPYIGMDVLIVGAANSACDVALETWQKGANVTMVIRKEQLYQKVKYWILPNIENRIKEGSITSYFSSTIKEITDTHVLIDTPKGPVNIKNDVVLAMTGYKPNYDFLEKIGIDIMNDNIRKPVLNEHSLESNISNIYIAGVVVSGLNTSELFIENTRDHGKKIVSHILKNNSHR